ncbi:MAG: acyltransferase [Treponema sp.]|nr:acyltransferase [Treponema sp.]
MYLQRGFRYKPYKMPIVKALPDVKIPESRISKFYMFILKLIVRPYIISLFGFAKVIVHGENELFGAFKRALSSESRCIAAFRHPNGAEPQLLGWFFLFKLKEYAARKKIRFARNPHTIFIYGYEVARWGGMAARLFMPNIGAIPIHHSKIDSKGMSKIYKTIIDGPWPVALAPEGQVSYTADSVPRLESGSIRIGFQAASQLADKNIRSQESIIPVELLPLSVHFRYGSGGKVSMEKLLIKIEKVCGFFNGNKNLSFSERLRLCRDHILEINEKRYGIKADKSFSFDERFETVINAALATAERMLGVKSEGDFFARLYRVRHVCWDKIFLPGVDSNTLEKMSNTERGVMDLGAGEAWHIARHQELADFGWYFRRPLPAEETALHNKIEYVQNLWDFANRSMGGAFSGRVNIFPKKIIIHTMSVINLSERLADYKNDKKAAINAALMDLEKAYINSINEINSIEQG